MTSFQIIELEEQKKIIQEEIYKLQFSNDPDKKEKIQILTNNYNDINEEIKVLKDQPITKENFLPILLIGALAIFYIINSGKKQWKNLKN